MTDSNTDTGDTVMANQTEINTSSTLAVREPLITTAVNFLQNSRIRHTTLIQKQQFLRSKGLSAEEIRIACERAGIFVQDPNSTVINMGISTGPGTYMEQQELARRGGIFGRLKEVLHSMALVTGLAYAVYWFYKTFIEPFLFGRKKKSVEDIVTELDQKVESQMRDVNRELSQIKEHLMRSSTNQSSVLNREFNSFKNDLDAIKGLLLNRKQFANPISSVAPSIPPWQLTSHRLSQSDNEKNDDAGSGSGSSETEVVAKNSDSSLEIM